MSKVINPSHYKNKISGADIQVVDIIEAFFEDNAHLSQACKYLLRAGRKTTSSYTEDLNKALWWLARAIMRRGGVIDLPEGVNPRKVTIGGRPLPASKPRTRRVTTKKKV